MSISKLGDKTMKQTTKEIVIVLVLTAVASSMLSAKASNSPGVYYYDNEQTEAMRYAQQIRYQAKTLDKAAQYAIKYGKANRKALEQAYKQQSAYAKLQASEEQILKARVLVGGYNHTEYVITDADKGVMGVLS